MADAAPGREINETMRNFGYPATTVAEYAHWAVLLRPQQATLGALVLAARGEATQFAQRPPPAFSELQTVIGDIETTLAACFGYDKINYLMLMMVDPHVHFHVIPRYGEPQSFGGATFADPGWPRVPNLGHAADIDDATRGKLLARVRNNWHQSRTVPV
jgi:diadenosine tetraphosphate (Ap4A) HIT family hydrolase